MQYHDIVYVNVALSSTDLFVLLAIPPAQRNRSCSSMAKMSQLGAAQLSAVDLVGTLAETPGTNEGNIAINYICTPLQAFLAIPSSLSSSCSPLIGLQDLEMTTFPPKCSY